MINATAKLEEEYYLGAKYSYVFDEPISPVGLKIKFTQQNGTSGSNCVGLTELETMTYEASLEVNTSADLSAIKLDNAVINGFNANTLAYQVNEGVVSVETTVNAGVTVLPECDGVVRVLTVSEDGSASKTYEITLIKKEECKHTNTEKTGVVSVTCTTNGYTGDTYCKDCGELLSTGATITAAGYKWNSGVITQEPTAAAPGIKTYTCTSCNATKTEEVAYVAERVAPTVSFKVTTNSSKRLVMTAQIDDYQNLSDDYEITGRGILYITSAKIGSRVLNVNTSGRTRVNFTACNTDGTYSYTIKPSSNSTSYTMRAFIIYKDKVTGKTVTEYSDVVRGSYNSLK